MADGKDGKLIALRHESVSTTSRFDDFIEPAALVSRHQYQCDNVETKHRLVRLDIGTPTYMRAPGESGSGGGGQIPRSLPYPFATPKPSCLRLGSCG